MNGSSASLESLPAKNCSIGYVPSAAGFPMISSSIGTRRMPGDFFDTNVLVYIASSRTPKADRAERLVRDGGIISVQVLNEIANVARREMRLSWPETRAFLSLMRGLLPVEPITVRTHETGLALAERYRPLAGSAQQRSRGR